MNILWVRHKYLYEKMRFLNRLMDERKVFKQHWKNRKFPFFLKKVLTIKKVSICELFTGYLCNIKDCEICPQFKGDYVDKQYPFKTIIFMFPNHRWNPKRIDQTPWIEKEKKIDKLAQYTIRELSRSYSFHLILQLPRIGA